MPFDCLLHPEEQNRLTYKPEDGQWKKKKVWLFQISSTVLIFATLVVEAVSNRCLVQSNPEARQ